MKALLIGGAGFIGHHLAIALRAQGHGVDIIDSLGVNNQLSLEPKNWRAERFLEERQRLLHACGARLLIQDARDYSAVSRLVQMTKPDVIVHLAAVAHADRSNKDPYSTFDHSTRTLENALDAARYVGVERFVFLSSSMVYGDFVCGHALEVHECKPKGIYGALKLGGEWMVRAYSQVFGMNHVIIRPSALYGPRCVSGRVIQKFIEAAIDGEPITVKGNGALDFTYIDDLVDGLILAMTESKARNETFNLTYGYARTPKDVADILKERFPGLEVRVAEPDKLMPERGTLVIAKARELLGYAPEWTIERGVPAYVESYLMAK